MIEYDVIIIGAGILGCFAARNLARYNLRVLVLEAREDVCTEITRANTGIIYQGYDQHPGSLKAAMCHRANARFENLCGELDVPYRKCGLMMLSFGPKADMALEKKLRQGLDAGLPGLSVISGTEASVLEPEISRKIEHALLSENTYTVNPWELGIAAFENARANGVEFRFNSEVKEIHRNNGAGRKNDSKVLKCPERQKNQGDFIIETEHETFRVRCVLGCGGMKGDTLWNMVSKPVIKLVPQDADYVIFDTSVGHFINHVISIEPEDKGEGLTLVPTVDGNIMLGPTRRDNLGMTDYSTDEKGIEELKRKCGELIPGLSMDKIIRCFGAARPNPYYVDENGITGKSINDFIILEENGFFNLAGVKTPGITCSNELGIYIAEKIAIYLNAGLRTDFSPYRIGIKNSLLGNCNRIEIKKIPEENCSLSGIKDLVEKDNCSDEKEIICRCKKITRGEVLEAIRRGATTIDGVKRRLGSGMGRCQGGFCTQRIVEILAENVNVGENIKSYAATKGNSEMRLARDRICQVRKGGQGSEFL